MDNKYKIGVEESNGDVIFALGRHLAAKTTSGPIVVRGTGQDNCCQNEGITAQVLNDHYAAISTTRLR